MRCRHCQSPLTSRFADLGTAPPSNSYLRIDQLICPERWYPLRILWCSVCFLVQTEDRADRSELFPEDYAYFSSVSKTWLKHAEDYVADVVPRFKLGPNSFVIEIASNDGYLLQYVKKRGIPCLGIEPTTGTAQAAREKGLAVREIFFGLSAADALINEDIAADLMVANNVLAHVPDINDFVRGFSRLLKPNGAATFEFPHLLSLVSDCQFDTIYHEHYSYLSLTTVTRIFERCGLQVFDVVKIPTHGGSFRVFAQRADTRPFQVTSSVSEVLREEEVVGIKTPAFYDGFQDRMNRIKNDLIMFLIDAHRAGKTVFAYGAAAKGNTLLNYAGVRSDLVKGVADLSPVKSGKFLPGSRIPVVSPDRLIDARPDYVLILPWNLKKEIMEQLRDVNKWGGKFVTAIPKLEILS
jgi:SAM-dependent methyltransferase